MNRAAWCGPLCTDGRMRGLEGSGTATYAAALTRAQRALDPAACLLVDDGSSFRAVSAQARAARWVGALWPGSRRATVAVLPDGTPAFIGGDLFRLAQVWFDVHRRLLPVRVPGAAGIMHWSYPVPLRLVGWRNLYTVHDAIPLTAPDLSPIDQARHRCLLRRIANGSARLVTVSAAARSEIAGALGLDPARIVDCGQGVPTPRPDAPLPAGLAAGGYFLVVGSVEPRKNIVRLVAGWRQSGTALPLVIAGPEGGQSSGLVPAGVPGLVRLPAVDAAALATLLCHARALLMPSLAEGFGLPVIEAMAAGTPVLTSRGGALEEVAGGAALLVDPGDPHAIAAGIRALAEDDALVDRLAAGGPANAARYTPERFAARLGALYGRLGEEAEQ